MQAGATTTSSNAEQLKRRVVDEIDKHADEIMGISKTILTHPESGFKEHKTSALAEGVLNDLGIETRNGLAITGVKGRLEGSSPGPSILIMGELDSNIVPQHPLADPDTGAAHACGHHCQIGNMLGVAYGLVRSGVMSELAGGVNFIAVPAEEYLELEYRTGLREAGKIEFLGGKPELIALGELDDSDICMLTHATTDPPSFTIGKTNNGMLGKTIRYVGYASHAGGSPHLGTNALNAAEVALAAIHAQRDTFKDEDQIRIHPIITRGGSVVNAVPDDVRMETYVRGASFEAILDANAKVDRALRAGALGVGAEVEIATAPGYLPFLESADLADLWRANAVSLVGEDEIGGFFCSQFLRKLFGEKVDECFHSIFAGNLGDVFSRFNAEVWDASPGEIAQKVAIVAGNFDHVTFVAQGEFIAIAVCAFGGMLYPHIGVRRKINVFAEELNRRHKVSDL